MATEGVIIPVLICLFGVLVWNSEAWPEDYDQFRLRSRRRARELSDRTRVRERLAQLGRADEYENFRMRQIAGSLVTACSTFLIALLLTGVAFFAFACSFSFGIAIYFLKDYQLSREVIQYRLAIESEFASIVEMLTLSLSAGETSLGALTRISQRSHGLLACEFARVVESVRAGVPFHEALDALGRRVDSVVIRRFVDSLVTAMLRGAPLIDVLQRHAAEARQIQRNILMDKAGKAEISMMVPVVFLILPISVLFALWPSLTHLNLFAS